MSGWHRDIPDFMKLEREVAKEIHPKLPTELGINLPEVIAEVDDRWALAAPGRPA